MTTTFKEQATMLLGVYNDLKKAKDQSEQYVANMKALNDAASTIAALAFVEASLKNKAEELVVVDENNGNILWKYYKCHIRNKATYSIAFHKKEDAIKMAQVFLMEQKLSAL